MCVVVNNGKPVVLGLITVAVLDRATCTVCVVMYNGKPVVLGLITVAVVDHATCTVWLFTMGSLLFWG